MNGADSEAEALRRNIKEELEKCTDRDLLDFIYKLFIAL